MIFRHLETRSIATIIGNMAGYGNPVFSVDSSDLLALFSVLLNKDKKEEMKKLIQEKRESPVDLEAETKGRTVLFYLNPRYKNGERTWGANNNPTCFLPIKAFLPTIVSWFPPKCGVLEVCAGNGYTSELLRRQLAEERRLSGYFATDLYKSKKKFTASLESGLSSDRAVRKYHGRYNVLVMIAPPCGSYADYYAIKALEDIEDRRSSPTTAITEGGRYRNSRKYCLYIGEIGLSDGGVGMFHYMLHGSRWTLLQSIIIDSHCDMFGALSEKKAYFFRLDIGEKKK